jgi:hypothetical protein
LLPPPAPAPGKNRVPTKRFAHILLTKWASPNRLLAATFPNNAARKKPRSVTAILGEPAKSLWLGIPALRTTPPCIFPGTESFTPIHSRPIASATCRRMRASWSAVTRD